MEEQAPKTHWLDEALIGGEQVPRGHLLQSCPNSRPLPYVPAGQGLQLGKLLTE
jgi:hypothetical protein